MNKIIWWVVGIVVVVIIVVLSMNKSDKISDLYNSNSPEPSASASASPNPTGTNTTTGIGIAGSQTYTALINKYGTNRIQFDAMCQANPSNPVFKAGTSVMFDNRSGDARIITIGGTKYSFPGYGYRIIKLGGTKLPAIVKLNCGAAINVGTITVEK